MDFLLVNMTDKTAKRMMLPKKYEKLGGRSLSSTLVADRVDPLIDALGPLNTLVFATGLLSGTIGSSLSRISVGAKSPLTGGIKEANAGGDTAFRLNQAGLRAILVEGMAEDTYVLEIGLSGSKLVPMPQLTLLNVSDTMSALRKKYGKHISAAVIGSAGERKMPAAGIAHTDTDGRATRYSARGGLGAVMGSKGLKAIVFTFERLRFWEVRDQETYKKAVRKYHSNLLSDPGTAERRPKYGTAVTLELVNEVGGLPTRNFREGQFEKAENIGGYRLYDIIVSRGGEGTPTHACMPGCVVRCSNRYPKEDGSFLVSPIEYETNAMVGSNLGIGDFDEIAEITRLCNEYGLDTIEVGVTLGITVEAGLLSFGDGKKAIDLVHEIGKGSELGKVLGQGAYYTAKHYGIERIPAVKKQAIPAYDPRAIKGNGVTYATSPMGADHTAGNTIGHNIDHLSKEGKIELSKKLQVYNMINDSLGACAFVQGILFKDKDLLTEMLSSYQGREWSWEELKEMAYRSLVKEVRFNDEAGLIENDLPEFFSKEPLPPHNVVWDFDKEELADFWSE